VVSVLFPSASKQDREVLSDKSIHQMLSAFWIVQKLWKRRGNAYPERLVEKFILIHD